MNPFKNNKKAYYDLYKHYNELLEMIRAWHAHKNVFRTTSEFFFCFWWIKTFAALALQSAFLLVSVSEDWEICIGTRMVLAIVVQAWMWSAKTSAFLIIVVQKRRCF